VFAESTNIMRESCCWSLLVLLVAVTLQEDALAFTTTTTQTSRVAVTHRRQRTTTATTASQLQVTKPAFLNDISLPFPIPGGGGDDAAFAGPGPYDGSDESLIEQAKRVLQSDLGINDPTLLDASFAWIGPSVDGALSKTDYIAAGRFFNLRGAFPDLDYRAHDFRIDEENGAPVVRCTCRVTGTMRGELRLRSGVLAPTGVTMRCPPEAVSMTFDRQSGKLTKLCTGFSMDRLVGNTQGTTGVQAASVAAGERVSDWDLLPPATVLSRVLARPAKPVPETTSFLAPFPETVMIQLAKGVISAGMAAEDPTLLADDFTFCTPIVGPVRKEAFLDKYAKQELAGYNPNFSNFRIDPYDPVRIWVDLNPSAPGFQGPPQAMSFTFDDDGFCTRITSWAVMDPSIGNAGGLGGPEGLKYATGQASPGITTRPLPRSLGRIKKLLVSPITGVGVDEYKLSSRSIPKTSLPKPPTPPVAPSKPPAARLAEKASPKPPKSAPPKPTAPKISGAVVKPTTPKTSDAVVKRLESLKDFTSSIRIEPPNISFPIRPPPAAKKSPTTTVVPKKPAKKSPTTPVVPKKPATKASPSLSLLPQLSKISPSTPVVPKKPAIDKAKQQASAKAEAERKRKAAAEQKAALAAAKKSEMERKKQEAEARKRQAATAASNKKSEMEAKKREAAAAAAAKKAEMEAKKQAEQQRREAAAKAKLAKVQAKTAAKAKPSPPPKPATDPDVFRSISQSVSSATINLLGLGKSDLEELPAPGAKSTKKAPMGVPTLSRWRQNSDKTITGLVSGSRGFGEGQRITTSPIASGTISSGEVVKTGSGSRYFLE